jgi:hypothetical protein
MLLRSATASFGAPLLLAFLAVPSWSGDPEERKAFVDSAVELGLKMNAIKPRPEELRWQQIPWMQDLTEAAKLSKAENRPLLVWASGDEPLERC